MNVFTLRSQQPPNSWFMSLEREPPRSAVTGVTFLAPWPGEGAGLHTPGTGLEPRTQTAYALCPELPKAMRRGSRWGLRPKYTD